MTAKGCDVHHMTVQRVCSETFSSLHKTVRYLLLPEKHTEGNIPQ